MTDCKHDWQFVQGLAVGLRCRRCGLMTGPKGADEKVQEMLTDALVTGTGMVRVTSEGLQRIDPATIYARPIDDLLEDAEKVMRRCQRGTINYNEANTLHAECYGTIGSLVRELRAAQQHLRERAKQGDLFEGEA